MEAAGSSKNFISAYMVSQPRTPQYEHSQQGKGENIYIFFMFKNFNLVLKRLALKCKLHELVMKS
jgi:hypothetical protein